MQNRIDWADAFKGILIILVVLGHSIQSVCMQRGDDFMDNYLWNLIYSFHMPAFMAMRGFLAYRPNRQCIDTFKDLASSILRRFRQLIVPFLIWSVIMYVVNHNVEHIYDYVLYPNKSYWFLWALFFIVVVFCIGEYISSKLRFKQEVVIGCIAFILMGIKLVLPDSKLLGFEYVAYYFLYYVMAYYLHKFNRLIPVKSSYIYLLAILWFFLGSFYVAKGVPEIVCWMSTIPGTVLNILYRITTATIFILMMFGTAQKTTIGQSQFWKCILEFGKISLGIYVVHMVLRVWLVRGLDFIMPWCPEWILMTITFVLLSIFSLWVVRFLSKWRFTAAWLLGKV